MQESTKNIRLRGAEARHAPELVVRFFRQLGFRTFGQLSDKLLLGVAKRRGLLSGTSGLQVHGHLELARIYPDGYVTTVRASANLIVNQGLNIIAMSFAGDGEAGQGYDHENHAVTHMAVGGGGDTSTTDAARRAYTDLVGPEHGAKAPKVTFGTGSASFVAAFVDPTDITAPVTINEAGLQSANSDTATGISTPGELVTYKDFGDILFDGSFTLQTTWTLTLSNP